MSEPDHSEQYKTDENLRIRIETHRLYTVGPPLEPAIDNALNLQPDAFFDVVTARHMLYHVPDIPRALREMKRISLNRKNSLFVRNERDGRTAAILSSLTSTCRPHNIYPQRFLTQLLTNLSATPISQLEQWLPDQRQRRNLIPSRQEHSKSSGHVAGI